MGITVTILNDTKYPLVGRLDDGVDKKEIAPVKVDPGQKWSHTDDGINREGAYTFRLWKNNKGKKYTFHFIAPSSRGEKLIKGSEILDKKNISGLTKATHSLSMEGQIHVATKILKTFTHARALDLRIPAEVIYGAKGLAFMTQVKGGFFLSVSGGLGIVIVRDSDGNWTGPSAFGCGGVGAGIQFGANMTKSLLVLNNNTAVKAFSGGGQVKLGASLSVAAGPLGREAGLDARLGKGKVAACFSYAITQGLFGGVSFDGAILTPRKSENKKFYGRSVKIKDILTGKEAPPPNPRLKELYTELKKLEDATGMQKDGRMHPAQMASMVVFRPDEVDDLFGIDQKCGMADREPLDHIMAPLTVEERMDLSHASSMLEELINEYGVERVPQVHPHETQTQRAPIKDSHSSISSVAFRRGRASNPQSPSSETSLATSTHNASRLPVRGSLRLNVNIKYRSSDAARHNTSPSRRAIGAKANSSPKSRSRSPKNAASGKRAKSTDDDDEGRKEDDDDGDNKDSESKGPILDLSPACIGSRHRRRGRMSDLLPQAAKVRSRSAGAPQHRSSFPSSRLGSRKVAMSPRISELKLHGRHLRKDSKVMQHLKSMVKGRGVEMNLLKSTAKTLLAQYGDQNDSFRGQEIVEWCLSGNASLMHSSIKTESDRLQFLMVQTLVSRDDKKNETNLNDDESDLEARLLELRVYVLFNLLLQHEYIWPKHGFDSAKSKGNPMVVGFDPLVKYRFTSLTKANRAHRHSRGMFSMFGSASRSNSVHGERLSHHQKMPHGERHSKKGVWDDTAPYQVTPRASVSTPRFSEISQTESGDSTELKSSLVGKARSDSFVGKSSVN